MVMVMVMAMCLTWSAFPQASFPPPPALPSATHSPPVSKSIFEFIRIDLFWVPKSHQMREEKPMRCRNEGAIYWYNSVCVKVLLLLCSLLMILTSLRI